MCLWRYWKAMCLLLPTLSLYNAKCY
jgi:hypothetical protein